MFNKNNVFITVNEEVSSIIQQYIIREIKKVLDKYKRIETEEKGSVGKLRNSISLENFSKVLTESATREQQKKLLHMIISEITINETREIDSIKLKINDSLVDYISKEEGVSIKDTPSSFMLRNIGMSVLNLDIAI